jgi:hypothetical protein
MSQKTTVKKYFTKYGNISHDHRFQPSAIRGQYLGSANGGTAAGLAADELCRQNNAGGGNIRILDLFQQ